MRTQPGPSTNQADELSQIFGANAGYVVEMYERYLRDPTSVDPHTRALFQSWSPPETLAEAETTLAVAPVAIDVVVGASDLARAIRAFGHLAAHLDPLGTPPPGDPSLELATYGLTVTDLRQLPAHIVGGPVAIGAPNAAVAIDRLRQSYGGTTGYEFRHVQSHAERVWLREVVETGRFREPREPIDGQRLLRQLTAVEAFETFMHRNFPGQKRFSIEGLDVLVPMLHEFIACAADDGTRWTWIGMAHRGRLAVLAHILRKSYAEIFSEFGHGRPTESVSPSEMEDGGWTGDVTYHLGARTAYQDGHAVEMTVALAPNPSHLEFINPVVEGMCRAADERRDAPGRPIQDEDRSIVILIHGDAAFAGEGIVAETLNLSRLDAYRTGGTIHLIENNQVGFTTAPSAARSTMYASDLAKGFEIPIVHVNADDPEATIAAIRLAHAYRQRFHKDFLIDLVGYRRWGHNEADEPTFTQPLLYGRIKNHPTVRAIWADRLINRREATASEAAGLLEIHLERLRSAFEAGAPPSSREGVAPLLRTDEATIPPTSVSRSRLVQLNEDVNRLPAGFTANPKLTRWLERRREAVGPDGRIDWAQAESLAFATLLTDGTAIRISGQDTGRGTFSQRHLVLRDAANGEPYIPLAALPNARASIAVVDSPLAEAAPLGFEYGYSSQARDTLVLWEGQFGDFANVADVLIDQFIAAGQAKWGQSSGLVLLLPHGLEGQGPEHSSARIERFLQLAAQDNLQIVNCTSAAQYFHLLRRQAAMLRRRPRPLVVFTPKSLLRHPLAASTVEELAEGEFNLVLDDSLARARASKVSRLILCSGHVYVDLVGSSAREEAAEVAIVRVEQLYPLPTDEIGEILASYPKVREVVWVQEEPMNMGAWSFVAPHIVGLLPEPASLVYVGRTERASPAVGSHQVYALEQDALVRAAFGQSDGDLEELGIEARKEATYGSRDTRPAARGIASRSNRGAVAQTRG